MSATRTYGGLSAEARRAQRRGALIDAALDLMASEGSRAVTVRGVCARAGLNQRYLYESFPDGPDELLVAAFDAARLHAGRAMRDAIASARGDGEAKVRAAAEAVVGLVADEPHHGRVLLFEGNAAAALHPHRQRMLLSAAEQFAREAIGQLGTVAPDEEDLTVVGLMVAGGVHELLLAWHSGALLLTREQVAERIAAAIVVSLLGDGARE